jgi:hypothetical protein
MNTSCEGIFFFTFVEELHDLIVFKDGHPRLMAASRDDKFFGHSISPVGLLEELGLGENLDPKKNRFALRKDHWACCQ